jgi:ATP/maltotriose-dependent transcriptional regulator MalT
MLAGLTSQASVEEAEARGLVELRRDGRRWLATLAHPLYGEVRRPRIGQLRARRLRGEIAAALAGTGGRRVGDTLRRAVLTVDSDLPPDPGLLTLAVHDAIRSLDLPVSERLARAAVEAGGGFEARNVYALVLSWLNRASDSEAEFATLAGQAASAGQHIAIAVSRAANLFWPGRDPAGAEAVLSAAAEDAEDAEDGRCEVAAVRAAIDAFLGRAEAGVVAAEAALTTPGLSDLGLLLASFGATIGLAALGRADEIAPITARAYEMAPRSVTMAVAVFGLCDLHLTALYLAGYLSEMDELAEVFYLRAADMPGNSRMRGVALRGYAARYLGRLGAAVRYLREAWAGHAYADDGFGFRALISLTQALAQAGDAAGARQALTELESARHPGFVFSDPEVLQARGWVAAAEGALSEAIRLAQEGASLAAARGQPGYEVLALHTAVRFGDRAAADRLAELAAMVDGPRAPVAAAHAAALAADDGDGLRAACARLEQMGDLAAAADAAGQAAAAYRRRREDTAARAAAAYAQRLAERCEGALTPALAASACPLPLTDREREIVTLAATGLSNREIAARLVVSVRTVEGHLYRASGKLGTSVRAEFAALLRGD